MKFSRRDDRLKYRELIKQQAESSKTLDPQKLQEIDNLYAEIGPEMAKTIEEAVHVDLEKEEEKNEKFKFLKIPGRAIRNKIVEAGMLPIGLKKTGENSYWIHFKKKEASGVKELVKEQLAWEKVIENGENKRMGKIVNLSKVLIDVPSVDPELVLPEVLKQINDISPGLEFEGRVMKPKKAKKEKDIPTIVLYVNDSGKHRNLVYIVLKISEVLKKEYGKSLISKEMDKARKIDDYVWISQGNYGHKMNFEEKYPDEYKRKYSDDGAIYRIVERRFQEGLQRAKNQLEIDKKLGRYIPLPGSYPSLPLLSVGSRGDRKDMHYLTNRLIAIQKDLLHGVKLEHEEYFQLGIRSETGIEDIQLGEDYLAPSPAKVDKLMDNIDSIYIKYINDSRLKNNEVRNRFISFISSIIILIHPLADVNGQSIDNLLSTILKELGERKIFLGRKYDMTKGNSLQKGFFSSLNTSKYASGELLDNLLNHPYTVNQIDNFILNGKFNFSSRDISMYFGQDAKLAFEHFYKGVKSFSKYLEKNLHEK